MTPNHLETILGMAFLENHPRLEVMQGLADLSAHLPDPLQAAVENCVIRIYLPETAKVTVPSQDAVFLALLEFCEDCVLADFPSMQQNPFRKAKIWMEYILSALEDAWRTNQPSSAGLAANRALDWLGESLLGQHPNSAELAGMRGFYMRRRNLRT